MPCCSVHGEWNAIRCGCRVHRDHAARSRFHSSPITISTGSRASSAIARRLLRVRRIVREQVAVVLHHHAAAARGDDDRLGAALDVRPPRVDVAPDERARLVVRRSGGCGSAPQQPPPGRAPREMPMRSSTRAIAASMFGASDGLHAAFAAISIRRACRGAGHAPRRPRSGMRRASSRGSRPFAMRPSASARAEQRFDEQRLATARSACARSVGAAADAGSSTMLAADVDQPAVLHARRTRRLAAAAGEAAVEMQLRLRGDRRALEHLLDQVDAPARAVELVAEQLVRRAGRRAEAAMHARAQDGVGLAAFGRVADESGRGWSASEVASSTGARD